MPKNPAQRSEDGIIVTPDFIAVIDGSTSKSQRRCHRLPLTARRSTSNGELAMLTVAATIKTMPAATTCHQFCHAATLALRRRYVKSLLPHLAQHPEDRLTASAIVFSRLHRQLWLVGDCQCLVDGLHFDNPKPYEEQLARQRADLIRSVTGRQPTVADADAARQAIIPHMLQAMQQQNKTYSVLDGFPVAMNHVQTVTLSLQPHQLVLATDGYPFLLPTLDRSEALLQQQLSEDPLNIGPRFMATKALMPGYNSFDDRAYIRFDIYSKRH